MKNSLILIATIALLSSATDAAAQMQSRSPKNAQSKSAADFKARFEQRQREQRTASANRFKAAQQAQQKRQRDIKVREENIRVADKARRPQPGEQ